MGSAASNFAEDFDKWRSLPAAAVGCRANTRKKSARAAACDGNGISRRITSANLSVDHCISRDVNGHGSDQAIRRRGGQRKSGEVAAIMSSSCKTYVSGFLALCNVDRLRGRISMLRVVRVGLMRCVPSACNRLRVAGADRALIRREQWERLA